MSLILLDSGQDGGGGDHSPITHTEALRESEALPMRVEIRSSSGQLVQVETATMDEDEIADTTLSVHIKDDGTPVAKGRMDLDGTGGVVHLTQANGSSPTASDPDGTEDTVDLSAGVRSWEHAFSGVTVATGDEVSVKARPETAAGVLSPTERIQEVVESRPSGSDTQVIHPEVDAQTSQSGSTGTLDLDIYDEQLRVTAVEFKKKTDSGGFDATWSTAWDSSTGTAGTDDSLTRSESIGLKKKHNVAVKWKLTFTDTDGNSQTIATTHEFDVDKEPEVKFTGSVDGSLNVLTSGVADEDTATVYVTVTTDGTAPNDPTSTNADETIDVSTSKVWGAVDTDVDASFGDVVRMKARGETSGGTLAGADFIEETSFKVEDPPPPAVDIDSFTAFDDGADIDYTVNFTPSSNVTDADNSVEATFIGVDGTVAATATESSPQTNNQITATDTGAGDGSSATDDWHKVELELLDSGGSTIETKTTRTLESV